jgi:alkylation response protein AidB-like acyl-CoA dehydrogenase
MNHASNRQQRRAQSKNRSQPQPPSENKLLHHRLAVMEQNLQRLANVSDRNTHAFSESLRMTEAMNIVLQRVLNEVLSGRVRCFGDVPPETEVGLPTRTTSNPQIDFTSYLREYWLCMLMADFAVWAKSIHKPDAPLIETASKDDVIEFGGT